MINVTKTFLPPFEEYTAILKRAWDNGWVTNNGELVQELEAKLKDYLGVKHLLFCSNGTIVLQMAIKALGITKEIITTPFSYVATANAIAWEGCTPVFVDIEPETFTIDPAKIEAAITKNTEAILATHVYGFPCKIEAIQQIAEKYSLKLVYDGAHAFGCTYGGMSLLGYGDISTCSFHATKVFHTVEGGALITNQPDCEKTLRLMRQFGHHGDDYYLAGINAKNSEVHAAMGLSVLPHFSQLIAGRKQAFNAYVSILGPAVQGTHWLQRPNFEYNYSYCTVLFNTSQQLMNCMQFLNENGIAPRRYFWPSLNTLEFFRYQPCPIAENIAGRILSLPLYPGINLKDVERIAKMVKLFI